MKHTTNLLTVFGAFALMALTTLFAASCDEGGDNAGGDSDTDSDVDSDSDSDSDTDSDTDTDTDSDTDVDHGTISVGESFACAVVPGSGVLKCWGDNYSGQLGNGTNVSSPGTAVEVLDIGTGVKDISAGDAGGAFTCVITAEGGVKCWGMNTYNELGDGTGIDSNVPVSPMGLASGVTDVETPCAVTSEGKIKCWGDQNSFGSTPIEIPLATDAIQVSGDDPCFLQSTGAVKCRLWEHDEVWEIEELGSDVTQISAGGYIESDDKIIHGCALLGGGEVKCWEESDTVNEEQPFTNTWTVLSSGAKEISVAGHACALMEDGHAKCWGDNTYGQFGNGTTTSSTEPVDVTTLDDIIVALDVGGNSTCALTAEGKVKCWGAWADSTHTEAFEIADF